MAIVKTLDILLRAQTKKFDRSMKRLRGVVGEFATAFGAIGVAGAGVAALSAGVSAARDFESQFAKSTAIMGELSEEMKTKLRDTAHEVATATTFSNAEAAESYFFLASAGLDAVDSINALPKVAAFAQAGMFDMATATDLLTDAQSALGLASGTAEEKLLELVRVSDVLIKANTLANGSAQQFSEALTNKAGTAAKNLGLSLEETVATLSIFADKGVKGAEAGTALAIVLRDMSTKARENKEDWDALGVSVFDSAGEFRGTAAVISELETAMLGMSTETKQATLATLGFNDKSVGFIQSLLGESAAIAERTQSFKDTNDITSEIATKTVPELEKAINQLKGAFVQLSDSSITPLLKGIGDLNAAFGDITGGAVSITDIIKDVTRPITLYGDAMSGIANATRSAFGSESQKNAQDFLDVVNSPTNRGPAFETPLAVPDSKFGRGPAFGTLQPDEAEAERQLNEIYGESQKKSDDKSNDLAEKQLRESQKQTKALGIIQRSRFALVPAAL